MYLKNFLYGLIIGIGFIIPGVSGSVLATIEKLKEDGVQHIKFLCIVAAPEGIEVIESHHPDVQIYYAVVDKGLNANNASVLRPACT